MEEVQCFVSIVKFVSQVALFFFSFCFFAPKTHKTWERKCRRITLPTVPERRHQRQVEELVIRRDSIVVSPMNPALLNNNKPPPDSRRREPGGTLAETTAGNNSSFTTALVPIQHTVTIGSLNKLIPHSPGGLCYVLGFRAFQVEGGKNMSCYR